MQKVLDMDYRYETILAFVKLDIGIRHNQKDPLIKLAISAAARELERAGIKLDLKDESDQLLLEMCAVHNYQHPNAHLESYPKFLRHKINSRILSLKMTAE